MVSGGVCFECNGGIVPFICHSCYRCGNKGWRATPVCHPDLLLGPVRQQTDNRDFVDRLNTRRLPPWELSFYSVFGGTFAFLLSPFLSSKVSTRYPPQRFSCRTQSLQVSFPHNAVMKTNVYLSRSCLFSLL